jgi:NAD(P)-dependent dehydrogenase (short-subunit alcohol dehydrogenase family)
MVESPQPAPGSMRTMKKVLITAGAAGIGREMVRAFAKEGARVAVIDIDAAALGALRAELPGLLIEACDLADLKQLAGAVGRALDALGGVDVLINNAGVAGPTAPVEDYDPLEWDRVMRVNLGGTFNVTRLVIPHLKKSAAGCIINMSSAAGKFGYPQRSAYAASKWGVIGLTKTLSMELGEFGIRANAILPGPVAGERMERVLQGRAASSGRTVEELRTSALANHSIKSFTEAAEVAALALFLASDAAKTISGQAISIDGDMHRSV